MKTDLSIKTNDITTSYCDAANNKEPMIFVHGFPFNKSMWDHQVEALKSSYRTITYDLRGFGQSKPGSKKASIPLYADDLITFMDALKINKATVCGLSMGGYILLNAVDRYPDRFNAIVLSDTQCLADSEEGKKKRYDTAKEVDEKGLDTFAENFLKSAVAKQTRETKKDVIENVKQMILSSSPESIKSALAAMAERTESCSHLKNIKVPTLILCGEEDELTTLPQSEFLFNNIPGAKMHAIQNTGHLSNLEQPDVFNKHLNDFLSTL